MRLLIVAVLVAACASAFAQVVLSDATHSRRLVFDRKMVKGQIVQKELWDLPPSAKLTQTTFEVDGTLTECEFTWTKPSGTTTTHAKITGTGAQVTTFTNGGASQSSQIPLMKRGLAADPSVNWFTTVNPSPGTTATFMSFDAERRYWEEVTVTFKGRGKLGKSAEGNLVTRQTARKTINLLLDDKGIPLVWEEGKLRLVRG
jgi:hypothetical protein